MKYKPPICAICRAELGQWCLIGNQKVCIICYERWLRDGPELPVMKCWYEKATDLYLLTPGWWDEGANDRHLANHKLTLCKSPVLTASIKRLLIRMKKGHCNVWMNSEVYLEQLDGI